MRQIVNHEVYGTITYEESLLSGTKKVYFNDVELQKVDKTTFKVTLSEEILNIKVNGNLLTGVILDIKGEKLEVIPKSKWYEYILAVLPFVLVMVWGNSVELCTIVPVVGGAIGGALSAFVSLTALLFSKKTNNVLYKVLIGLAGLVAAFGLCAAVGFMIISAL